MTRNAKLISVAKRGLYQIARMNAGKPSKIAQGILAAMAKIKAESRPADQTAKETKR